MFNWFKRFQQPASTPEAPTESEVQTPEVAPEVTPDAPAADDYLAWAKAAYQNIKQKEEVEKVEEVKEVEEERQEERGEVVASAPLSSSSLSGVEETEVPEIAEVSEVINQESIPEAIAPELVAAVPVEAIEEIQEEAVQIEAIEPESVTPVEIAPIPSEIVDPEPVNEIIDEPIDEPVGLVDPSQVEPEEIEPEPVDLDQVEPEILEPEAIASIPPEISEPEIVDPEPIVLDQGEIIPDEVIEAHQEVNQEAIPTEAIEPEIPATSLPLWARETEAERLERLESLVVEEPVPLEAEQSPSAPSSPDVVFDEGFLWSAQVLASQGRRPEDVTVEEISWLKRLRQGLEKTRLSLINQLKSIVGQGPLDKDAVEAIEALLLQADVGVEATDYIITTLQTRLREEVLPPDQAIAYLKKILRDLLDQPYQNNYAAAFVPDKDTLNIWMMTGVNGAGKTTTIGKLAHLAQKSGYSCLIGAADTFRAAAVEQVKIWGQRSGTEVIANPGQNTDPGSVVFDAITAAQARNIELLLIDTAGRLQNKKNLMDELGKIRRIVDKKAPNARVESLLVLDATLGQNGLRQAQVFAEAAKLSGVVLTKLDGTAKGGVALAVVQQLGLPIRFIGAGEGIEDLRPFSSYEFVEALLNG
jgi:fused signal recognition particle receptor